jgi:hypothetical protein
MNKIPTPLRDVTAEPSQDGDAEGQAASADVPDYVQGKRLRNSLILANIAIWLIVIVAIKWLMF